MAARPPMTVPAARATVAAHGPLLHQLGHLPANVRQGLEVMHRTWRFLRPENQPGDQRRVTGGPGSRWTPVRPPGGEEVMGVGAEGVVHMWCKVETGTERIMDRMIVKQVIAGRAVFTDPDNWSNGEPRESVMANHVWKELDVTDRQYALNCLGWGEVDDTNFHHKLYYEYCDHGDLYDLILAHESVSLGGVIVSIPIPEPFLWMLFEALAKVAVAMENTERRKGMIHGDLHPGNILLGDPDPERFGMYPVPKVADYGSSRLLTTNTTNRLNPVINDPCCVEYAPHELARWIHRLPGVAGPPQMQWEDMTGRISKKTNIWQIGMIMCAAMRLEVYVPETDWRRPLGGIVPLAEQLRWHFDGNGRKKLRRHNLAHPTSNYSAHLHRLVYWCLRYTQASRPNASTLLNQIRRYADFQGTDAPLARGANIPARLRRHRLQIVLNDRRARNRRFTG